MVPSAELVASAHPTCAVTSRTLDPLPYPSLGHSSREKPPALQLGLWRLETGHKNVPDLSGGLVEIEAHPLGAEVLGHNVELNT